MATSASSHRIIVADSRQVVLVNARPGELVNNDLAINLSRTQLTMLQSCDDMVSVFDDGGPAYTTVLMKLKTDHGQVPTLVPLDGSHHVLDHATYAKIARYIITPSIRVNDDKIVKHLVKIEGNDIVEEEEVICVICLEKIKSDGSLVELECAHWYHADCIMNWLRLKKDCPICRAEVMEI